ncbi:MAG: hypothetical protein QOE37_2310 [Microbacteriaceae bacterium]|nr:hypothetical protein [Microbacteriaceae bacterium]
MGRLVSHVRTKCVTLSRFEHYLLRLFWMAASQPLMVTKEMRVNMMLRESEFRLKREMKLDLLCDFPLLSR